MFNQDTTDSVNQQLIKVLLVEDNESDIIITKRTLDKNLLPHEVHVVEDGLDALNYLYHKPPYSDSQKYVKPDLMIVDLHMPNLDGHELIKKLKTDKSFHSIHIIVLSASRKEEDVKGSMEQGAVTYIHKSMDDVELAGILKLFNDYWRMRHSS